MAYAVTIATGKRERLGKAYIWDKVRELAGFEPTGDAGQWLEDGNTANQSLYMLREYYCEPTLDSRAQMRRELLDNQGTALLAGTIQDGLRKTFVEEGNGYIVPGFHRRNHRTLCDAPKSFFTIDVDKLDLSGRIDSVFEADGELPDIIADLFDTAGLDWMIADCVMALSSSHGIIDKHVMSAHIDYHLDEPLTLAAQKTVAAYINMKMRAAGITPEGKNFLDPTLYEPARLMFTAPAELRQRVIASDGIKTVSVKAPVQRVRIVQRGQGRITVPQEALKDFHTDVGLAHVRALSRKGYSEARKTGKATPTKLAPGNVHVAVTKRAYATVLRTPEHRLEQAKLELSAALKAEVLELPDNDMPGKLTQRLREVEGSEFNRAWATALARRYGWRSLSAPQATNYRASVSVDAARAALGAQLRSAISEGISFAETPPDPAQMIVPRAKHLLISVPPGLGKTKAALDAIRSEHLMTHRLSYLVPNITLGDEAAQRMRKRLPTDEYTQSRVRHHKGRKSFCTEASYGRLAAKIEALGASPVKSVCGYCPRKDVCPWPAQSTDKDSGLVFGQHAHAVTTLAKVRDPEAPNAPSVGVIDEDMLGTLIREKHRPIKLKTLETWAARTQAKRRDGKHLFYATVDLQAWRAMLLKALREAKGDRVKVDDLLAFRRVVTVTTGDKQRRMATIDAALRAEHDALSYYNKELNGGLISYHEAVAAKHSHRGAERRIAHAAANLKMISWFLEAYRAVKGSLGVEGREHVYGLRVHKRSRSISLHLRADLPDVMKLRNWVWLDGTADLAVWRMLVGQDVDVADGGRYLVQHGPYKLYQYADRPYGKRFFGAVATDTRSNLARLHRFLRVQQAKHGEVLFIGQKEVVERVQALGLPDGIHCAHFNAVRGLDAYKDVPCAVIVGQALPTAATLEVMTEALHFDDPATPALDTGSGKASLQLAMADGTMAEISTQSYADPRIQAMRRQIVDAEVKQALHRLRLFDRTEANPAEIHLFGQTDTGLPITKLRDWRDAEFDHADVLLARGVVSADGPIREQLLPGMTDRNARYIVAAAKQRGAAEWPLQRINVGGKLCLAHVRPGASLTSATTACPIP